jgi:putative transposase
MPPALWDDPSADLPYYPQSNGKVESWHKTVKRECIRPLTPLNLPDARRIVASFAKEHNEIRLHSGIGYVAPLARLEGRDRQIIIERRTKLAAARQARASAHQRLCHLPTDRPLAALAVA